MRAIIQRVLRPRVVIATALMSAVLVAGCSMDKQTVVTGEDQIAVHAVLNPGLFSQVVLVERTLTGRTPVAKATPFDSLDPIVSGGGVPVSAARVVIYGPNRDSAIALEDRTTRSDKKGAGVYRITTAPPGTVVLPGTNALAMIPGRTYSLRVATSDGGLVTGETTIPGTSTRLPDGPLLLFNRDRDSVFLSWTPVPLAARYELHFDSPRGGFQLFVDSLQYLVSGSLENTSQLGRPKVFVPGFRQHVRVAAVDANYHDYYRTGNDRFTARGLLQHLVGGVGLFGSYELLQTQEMDISGLQREQVAGSYVNTIGASGNIPTGIVLYVESTIGGVTLLSGRAANVFNPSDLRGVLGTLQASGRLELAMLRGQSSRDTLLVIEGTFDNGTINGNVRGLGTRVVYQRRLQ